MRPGSLIAHRFRVDREVGRGGMGTVFRADDLHTGGAVALKVLHSVRDAERFRTEATLLAELRHPAFVRHVAHGELPGGGLYLAMEWIEGSLLSTWLSARRPTVSDCVEIGGFVAEALGAVHALGIVHRDVKPSNIILEAGDPRRVKLLDFGLARRYGDPKRYTTTGVAIGTPHYMAPEQARGNKVDPRADVFALGCVLYECLTGAPPFMGDDVMAVLAKVLFEEPRHVSEACPAAPPELEQLLARFLAKDADERPGDGNAAAAELAELIPSLPTEPQAPTWLEDTAPARQELAQSLSGGEQRVVCILFIGESPGAPLEACRATVVPFGARLEVLADGSRLVLLAPTLAATDQAARAARCALALRALNDAPIVIVTGRALSNAPVPIGKAIDEGVAALRALPRGEIRLDHVTAGLLDARFEVAGDPSGPRLIHEHAVAEEPRTVAGRRSGCVGRERELAHLEGLFDECIGEPVARAVLVMGPPGIGKSRVRQELLARLRARGRSFELLLGSGDPLRVGSPLALLAAALRRAAGILDAESQADKQRKLRVILAQVLDGVALSHACAFLGELVGAPVSRNDLRPARQDPRLMADLVLQAWLTWLEAVTAAQPIVLVLEDLHWGDVPSVRFVDEALRRLHDRPILAIAFARPEVQAQFPGLWQERSLQVVHLGGLLKKASERLVRQLMPEAQAEAVERLVARAEGNPFFLEELVRALTAGPADDLPDTVMGMVQARLDALGTEPKHLLRAGAIFGEVFWRGAAHHLLGRTIRAETFDEWLGILVEKEVITRKSSSMFPDEEEYAFRHALLRDCAYATLTDGDRRLGHRLAGAWLDERGCGDAVVLATHYELGGEPTAAIPCYERAAAQALEANDLMGAIERAERAVACGAEGERLAKVRLVEARARFWRGEHTRAEADALEAARLAAPGGPVWFHAAAEVIASTGHLGRYEKTEQWARQLLSADPKEPALIARLDSASRAVGYLLDGGRVDLAGELLALIEAEGGAVIEEEPLVAARVAYARAKLAINAGDVAGFLHHCETALRLLEDAGDARGACEQRINLSGYVDLGDAERAEAELRRALQTADQLGAESLRAVALLNLGTTLAHRGTLRDAREALLVALALSQDQKDNRITVACHLYLSTVAFLAGDLAESERCAKRALSSVTPGSSLRGSALAALARAYLAQDRGPEARVCALGAMQLIERLGHIEEYEALARLVHAQALEAVGERTAALEALRTACQRLFDRASKISDATLRQSFLTRVPDNARTLALAEEWGCPDEATVLAGAKPPR